jgi:hypothetical protein
MIPEICIVSTSMYLKSKRRMNYRWASQSALPQWGTIQKREDWV